MIMAKLSNVMQRRLDPQSNVLELGQNDSVVGDLKYLDSYFDMIILSYDDCMGHACMHM